MKNHQIARRIRLALAKLRTESYPDAISELEQLERDLLPSKPTPEELRAELRRRIDATSFLCIIEEVSETGGLLVMDDRDLEHGGGGCVAIDNIESLDFLIEHGAAEWLNSPHNGVFAQ